MSAALGYSCHHVLRVGGLVSSAAGQCRRPYYLPAKLSAPATTARRLSVTATVITMVAMFHPTTAIITSEPLLGLQGPSHPRIRGFKRLDRVPLIWRGRRRRSGIFLRGNPAG